MTVPLLGAAEVAPPLGPFLAGGIPEPQGSKEAFAIRRKDGSPALNAGGHQIVNQTDHNAAALKIWRGRVVAAAVAAMRAGPGWHGPAGEPLFAGAVAVRLVFTMPRPKSHYRTGKSTAHLLTPAAPARPETKPDLDKLARAVLDALTIARVWADDCRVVEFDRLAEFYPGTDPESLNRPGALIAVRRVLS